MVIMRDNCKFMCTYIHVNWCSSGVHKAYFSYLFSTLYVGMLLGVVRYILNYKYRYIMLEYK